MARTSIDKIRERDVVSERHVNHQRTSRGKKFGVGYKERKKKKKKEIKLNKK